VAITKNNMPFPRFVQTRIDFLKILVKESTTPKEVLAT
jgi:hypothetical protein